MAIVPIFREVIVFVLCLGIGQHIALGMVLHAPGLWPWNTAGLHGVLSGLTVYGLLQAGRTAWKIIRQAPKLPSKDRPNVSW
jgi:hypothetical protein